MKNPVSELVDKAGRDGPERLRAASRLMSMVQNDPACLPKLFQGMRHWPEAGMVLGITGPPGVGKSTLIDRLTQRYRRCNPEGKVGIIAVDPSSPFTGGAILGDRVRMMQHSTDPCVFIRSLGSRGHLGGLALGIKGILRIMGLVGCDLVLLETVGVGQSETEVFCIADYSAIVLAPGHGDDIQLLKAGLLEGGDYFIINKADRDGTERLQTQLMAMLNRGIRRSNQSTPHVAVVSAARDTGIEQLLDHFDAVRRSHGTLWREQRQLGMREEIAQAILQRAHEHLCESWGDEENRNECLEHVLNGNSSVDAMAEALIRHAAAKHHSESGKI